MVTTRPILYSSSQLRRWDRGLLILILAFALLLPLFTPRIYAVDSVEYYVYIRSLFFDGDLDFSNDYARFHELNPEAGIKGGLLETRDPLTKKPINVAPVGTAILWTPAFLLAHGGVLLARAMGSSVPADGYSAPYIWAVCFASIVYGLLGLLLSYTIARRYIGVWAATTATLVCWLASPLIFYMYISPPWSHTAGLFATALLIWYWQRTRGSRSLRQWLALGVLGGLMVLTREQLGLFLLLPAIEALTGYWRALQRRDWAAVRHNLLLHTLFLLVFVLMLTPQLLTYQILNGRLGPSTIVLEKLNHQPDDPHAHGFLGSGHFWDTLVDARPSPVTGRWFAHGAFLWTPVWALGVAGLFLLLRRDRWLAIVLLLTLFAQIWVNGRFGTTWHLSSAFGFRRLIEASPLFVLGVGLLIERVRLPRSAWSLLGALLIVWNVGLIAQWTVTNKELRRGLVWDGMLRNQLAVPGQAGEKIGQLLFNRCALVENGRCQ
jgi:hypothetical protein